MLPPANFDHSNIEQDKGRRQFGDAAAVTIFGADHQGNQQGESGSGTAVDDEQVEKRLVAEMREHRLTQEGGVENQVEGIAAVNAEKSEQVHADHADGKKRAVGKTTLKVVKARACRLQRRLCDQE